jgi:hypothetical protein
MVVVIAMTSGYTQDNFPKNVSQPKRDYDQCLGSQSSQILMLSFLVGKS